MASLCHSITYCDTGETEAMSQTVYENWGLVPGRVYEITTGQVIRCAVANDPTISSCVEYSPISVEVIPVTNSLYE